MAGQTPYSNLGRYLQGLKKKRENESKTLQGKKLGKAPAIARTAYANENVNPWRTDDRENRETIYKMNHDPYAYGREAGGVVTRNLKKDAETGRGSIDYAAERGANESKRKRIKKYNVQGL